MTKDKRKKIKFELYEDTAKNLIRFFKMNFSEDYKSLSSWSVMRDCENHFSYKEDLVKDLKQTLSNFNQNMSDNSEVKVNDRNYVFDLVCEQNKNVQNLKPFINHLYKTLEKGGVYV